jgi:uncharacterized membrane protein YciS (DUF1049 family)
MKFLLFIVFVAVVVIITFYDGGENNQFASR